MLWLQIMNIFFKAYCKETICQVWRIKNVYT